jgi:hypothetical protein
MFSTLHPVLAILLVIDLIFLFISCLDTSPFGPYFKWFTLFGIVLLGALAIGIPHI